MGTVKRLIEKEGDPYLALLAYRSTPLQNGYSLLMCRKLRGIVPITREKLQPKVPDKEKVKHQDMIAKEKDFDKYHKAKETPPLAPGERVWIPDRESEALVESEVAPRSYEFTTSDGSTVRRNQSSVRRLPGTPQNVQGEEEPTRDSAERNSEPANEQDRSASETSDVSAKETDTIPVRRSTRERKARDRWEPRWSS